MAINPPKAHYYNINPFDKEGYANNYCYRSSYYAQYLSHYFFLRSNY